MPNPILLSRRSLLVMPIALAACKKGWDVLELSGLTMGTSYSIVAVDHSRSVDKAELARAVDASLIRVIRQILSTTSSRGPARLSTTART